MYKNTKDKCSHLMIFLEKEATKRNLPFTKNPENKEYFVELLNEYNQYANEVFLFFIDNQVQEIFADNKRGIYIANLLTEIAKSNGLSDEIILWMRRLVISLDHSSHLGNVCLPINNLVHSYGIEKEELRKKLFASTFLGLAESHINVENPGISPKNTMSLKPFLIDSSDHIYFLHFFNIELRLAKGLFILASKRLNNFDNADFNTKLHQAIRALSSQKINGGELDWQLLSAILVLNSYLLVISGGPGTGKSTTVGKIIFLLFYLYPKISIGFCAPTGKASKRLENALIEQIKHWPLDLQNNFYRNFKFEVLTVHRLLGIGISGKPLYHKKNVLPYDVIIVDEASMLDQTLACYLIESLNSNTRLILLGDKDQLSSVEPGSVFSSLSDISCLTNEVFLKAVSYLHFSIDQIEEIKKNEFLTFLDIDCFNDQLSTNASDLMLVKLSETLGPLAFAEKNNKSCFFQKNFLLKNCCVWLEKNYRFDSFSPIGQFANQVKRGSFEEAISYSKIINVDQDCYDSFCLERKNQVHWYVDNDKKLSFASLVSLIGGYCHYFDLLIQYFRDGVNTRRLNDLFLAFNHFRILCFSREGNRGAESINKIFIVYLDKVVEHAFSKKIKKFDHKKNIFSYAQNLCLEDFFNVETLVKLGTPIMVTENNYSLKLFNGDIGIVLPSRNGKDAISVYFPNEDVLSFKDKFSSPETNATSLLEDAYREFPLSLLPSYEIAFAMTIHKSQGSEFSEVAVILPEEGGSLSIESITRELLYTGVTRARFFVAIFCGLTLMRKAISNQLQRNSGLMSRLKDLAVKYKNKKS